MVPFDLSSNDDEPVADDVAQHQYDKRTSQQDVLWDHMASEQGFIQAFISVIQSLINFSYVLALYYKHMINMFDHCLLEDVRGVNLV